MKCRPGCGACCTEISISSPLPGHPQGKPAGVRCQNLTPDQLCGAWQTDLPDICQRFSAVEWLCGQSYEEAVRLIRQAETGTIPC